jgi:hypothetical protein
MSISPSTITSAPVELSRPRIVAKSAHGRRHRSFIAASANGKDSFTSLSPARHSRAIGGD